MNACRVFFRASPRLTFFVFVENPPFSAAKQKGKEEQDGGICSRIYQDIEGTHVVLDKKSAA
jgi:hypothetical protein